MEDRILVYQAWTPPDAFWAQWVKPVLFANPNIARFRETTYQSQSDWRSIPRSGAALILDLPGSAGVFEGLALARLGFLPVPLYNGVNDNSGSMAVDVRPIVHALFKGAAQLRQYPLPPNAPPVFLLDASRMNGSSGRHAGLFDNRWCVFPQDMPSASVFLQRGIRKIIVRSNSERIRADLAHVLRRYQEQGLEIYHSSTENPKDSLLSRTEISKPSRYRSAIYRFQVITHLRRNAAGGFGSSIPEPEQYGGTGMRYYGYG